MAPTSRTAEPRHHWLMTAGLGAGMVLGFILLRWLPNLRRRSKIDVIRTRAAALTERIAEFTEDAAERASDGLADLTR